MSVKKNNNLKLKSDFFTQMHSMGMQYCVLRNHEHVISESADGDIDCIADISQFSEIRKLFLSLCESYNFQVLYVGQTNKNLVLKAVNLSEVASSPDALEIVHFHFVPYVSLYLTEAQRNYAGLATRVWVDDIDTSTCSVGGVDLITPSIKWQLVFNYARMEFKNKDKYKVKCMELSTQLEGDSFDGIKGELFDTFDRKKLVDFYSKAKLPKTKLKIFRWPYIIALMLKDLFKAKGLVIVFSGPDGAGKTTTNNSLTSLMQKKLQLNVRNVKHLYPINTWLGGGAVKAQSKLRGLDLTEKDALERDRGAGFFWKLRRLIGLLLIIAQYPLGLFYARIKTLSGVTTIVDTSVFDAFVKGHRPQYKLLEKLVIPILPKADLWFVLRAEPHVIVSRKPELTVEEIEDYYNRIDILSAKSNSKIINISSEDGERKALHDVALAVVKRVSDFYLNDETIG